jgi:hypothetical protein
MQRTSGPNGSFTAGLIEALYALDEPWRGRFLVLAANLATGWQWGEDEPGQAELAAWLEENLVLQRVILHLLRGWMGAELCLDVNAASRSS